MELLYRVHGAHTVQHYDTVIHRGKEVKAPVDCLEVELVHASDVSHGSLTLRFFGEDAADMKKACAGDYVKLAISGPVAVDSLDEATRATLR